MFYAFLIARGARDGVHIKVGVTQRSPQQEMDLYQANLDTPALAIGQTGRAIASYFEANETEEGAQKRADEILAMPRKQKIRMALDYSPATMQSRNPRL